MVAIAFPPRRSTVTKHCGNKEERSCLRRSRPSVAQFHGDRWQATEKATLPLLEGPSVPNVVCCDSTHTGYDIADLYKVDLIVPLVFETVAASDQNVESRVRQACRDMFRRTRFLERFLPDIREVLNGGDDSGTGADQSEGRSESLDDRTEGRDIPWQHDREDS